MRSSRFRNSSILAEAAVVRVGGVLAILAVLWLAVAWAVAVP
jgi:hypothetical protein